jgi:hypothetical protein
VELPTAIRFGELQNEQHAKRRRDIQAQPRGGIGASHIQEERYWVWSLAVAPCVIAADLLPKA